MVLDFVGGYILNSDYKYIIFLYTNSNSKKLIMFFEVYNLSLLTNKKCIENFKNLSFWNKNIQQFENRVSKWPFIYIAFVYRKKPLVLIFL